MKNIMHVRVMLLCFYSSLFNIVVCRVANGLFELVVLNKRTVHWISRSIHTRTHTSVWRGFLENRRVIFSTRAANE